jgi:hypothetical protein
MEMVLYYVDIVFPLKSFYVRETNRNGWIAQGLNIYSK